MLISELNDVAGFPVWGYFGLFLGASVMVSAFFCLLALLEEGTIAPLKTGEFWSVVAVISLIIGLTASIIAPIATNGSQKYENFSVQLQQEYGLKAPEAGKSLMGETTKDAKSTATLKNILDGKEFLATDATGEKVFVVAVQQGDFLEIEVKGEIVKGK